MSLPLKNEVTVQQDAKFGGGSPPAKPTLAFFAVNQDGCDISSNKRVTPSKEFGFRLHVKRGGKSTCFSRQPAANTNGLNP